MVIVLAVIIVISSLNQQLAFAQTQSEPATVLESNSDQGSFRVTMKWTQTGNGSNKSAFNVQFIEPETGKQLEDIVYDFIVISASGNEVVHRVTQASGSNQTATLSVEGPYTIRIANIDGLGESAEFHVRVTPEFSPVLIVAAGGFALAALFGTKSRKEL